MERNSGHWINLDDHGRAVGVTSVKVVEFPV
jgi:hypothetical protein